MSDDAINERDELEDEYEDEDYDDIDYAAPHLQVDARTLVAHEDILQEELLRLQKQFEILQGNRQDEELNKEQNASFDAKIGRASCRERV